MKKIISILLIINTFLFAVDINNKVVISIPKQDSAIIKIPALDLKVGESGIITREVNKNTFILGVAIIDEINDGIASIDIKEFKNIKDKYMPTPIGNPSEGDKITFRILYKRYSSFPCLAGGLLAKISTTHGDLVHAKTGIDSEKLSARTITSNTKINRSEKKTVSNTVVLSLFDNFEGD